MRWFLAAFLITSLPLQAASTETDKLNKIIAEEWQWQLRDDPENATFVGERGHDDRLMDRSAAAWQRRREHNRETLERYGHGTPDDWMERNVYSRLTLTGLTLTGLLNVALFGLIPGVLILVVAGGLLALQFFTSDKLALRAMGVREVSPQEAPELHAMIDRLCVQADLPKPKVGVMNSSMPNAFAMGRSQKNSTVCATNRPAL